MGIWHVTTKLLKGALIGGITATVGCFILLTIVGFIFGYGGPMLALYYAGLLIFYAAPTGMLVGAVIGVIRAVRKSGARIGVVSGAWVGLLLLGFVALLIIPHRLIGEQRTITHGATWWIDSEPRTDCANPVVTLLLFEYAHHEEICSALLYIALESETREVIPITYVVTYDFGEARGYHLSSIGAVEISSYSDRVGGGGSCGREPFPDCDSLQAKNDRMLYESSWVGE
jgi:hypothetical protein